MSITITIYYAGEKERLRSTHCEKISRTIRKAAERGVGFWESQKDFRPEDVRLYNVARSADI